MFASCFPPRCVRQFPFTFLRQHDNQPRGFLDAHCGVVHEHGIGSSYERRNFSFAVAFVPLDHFVKAFWERKPLAFFLMLFPTALRAHFRRSIQKNLQLGIREHNSPDTAPFHHDPTACASALLLRDQHLAHFCNRREPRRRLRYFRSTNLLGDVRPVQENTILRACRFLLSGRCFQFNVCFPGKRFEVVLIEKRSAPTQGLQRQRTVQRPPIHIQITAHPPTPPPPP